MAKDINGKLGWAKLGLQAAVLLVAVVLAWGVASADLKLTKHRVKTLETAMETLAKSTTEMALDMREIKTLMKKELVKKPTE